MSGRAPRPLWGAPCLRARVWARCACGGSWPCARPLCVYDSSALRLVPPARRLPGRRHGLEGGTRVCVRACSQTLLPLSLRPVPARLQAAGCVATSRGAGARAFAAGSTPPNTPNEFSGKTTMSVAKTGAAKSDSGVDKLHSYDDAIGYVSRRCAPRSRSVCAPRTRFGLSGSVSMPPQWSLRRGRGAVANASGS